MCYDVQIPHSEENNPTMRVSVTVSKRTEPKVAMDINDKQRAIIEFLPLERYASQEIVKCLRNVYHSAAHCRVSVLRWISEVRRGNEEPRNEGRPGRPN
jgi:hypothetical protein